jgi:glycosyltransferase involved in cell wall biosynthesis
MRILQVSASDKSGGAESVAVNLARAYRARGHQSQLAVGRRHGDDPAVKLLPRDRGPRSWRRAAARRFHRWRASRLGQENFHFPGTRDLLRLFPDPPEILHCHNLHGNYFDLRELPRLCRQLPVVMTLHDAWLLSGHCAHSLGCDRWRYGCGRCPDLSIYPAVRRDATADNWSRKQAIYAACRLYAASPSRWLLRQVEQSMLQPGIVDARVIPNGVDQAVFTPGDKRQARRALGLPPHASILLFVANDPARNPFKDFATLQRAACRVGRKSGDPVLLVALGSRKACHAIGPAPALFPGHVAAPHVVASYYRAADLYLHAARADTFPTVVLEALACGTPVVATAVGGIPEQVRGLHGLPGTVRDDGHSAGWDRDHATGALVARGDAAGLAEAASQLLARRDLLARLARNAARDAARRFTLSRQVADYLSWYGEILAARASRAA